MFVFLFLVGSMLIGGKLVKKFFVLGDFFMNNLYVMERIYLVFKYCIFVKVLIYNENIFCVWVCIFVML